MNWSSLSSNEKLAVYGSVAVVVGGIVGGTLAALGWIAVLAAIAMLVIIFLPQMSPSTRLPGAKGSLMLIAGGVAAVAAVLALLTIIGFLGEYFQFFAINAIFFLIAVAGGLLMGWAGWQEFQAEGGRFQLGTPAGAGGPGAAPPPPSAAPPPPPPSMEPPSPPPSMGEPPPSGGMGEAPPAGGMGEAPPPRREDEERPPQP